MPKRRPIEYTSQFVPGVFRSAEEVASELEALDENGGPTAPATLPKESPGEPASRSSAHRSFERSSVRSNERYKALVKESRRTTRHSFDVWQDQLLALVDIQAQRFADTGKKPKMGDLVKEALDDYIRSQRSNERTNVRTNGRFDSEHVG